MYVLEAYFAAVAIYVVERWLGMMEGVGQSFVVTFCISHCQ